MLQPTQEDSTHVIGMTWPEFTAWFSRKWEPGQHIAGVGPTGQGKSTFFGGIVPLRKYVLALDGKGGDPTLDQLGWPRVSWPPPKWVRDAINDGRPVRLIVGPKARTPEEFAELARILDRALDAAFEEGGWTIWVDELQISAQHMKLAHKIERNLIAARARASSMVTAYQAPAWVPTAASRQARWLVVWPTKDEDVIASLARKAGRSKRVMMAAFHALPDFHELVIGQNPRMPMILTSAPELPPARQLVVPGQAVHRPAPGARALWR
jgi:hypothetical protein